MLSGCLNSQGGAYPPTSQNGLVHLETGTQNMVASVYPDKSRVVCGCARSQQSNAQSNQNMQGSRIKFQQLRPEYRTCSLHSSEHQTTRNADFSSLALVPIQHNSYLEIPEDTVCNSGQQHFLKGLDVKHSGLEQGKKSTPLQGKSFGLSAQMFSLQDLCSPVSESKVCTSPPLLCPSLKGHPSDFKSLITTSSSSEKMGSNVELDIRADTSDERYRKNQEVRSSLASLNCGLNKTQQQQKISPSSHSCQPSKAIFEFGEAKSWTDQMFDFIDKEIAFYKSVLRKKEDLVRQSPSSSGIQHCTNVIGQTLEQDSLKSSKGTELYPNSNQKCDTSASEKHLTEHQHVMLEVATTCTKNEPESPLIVTAVSGVTLLEETEKYPRLTVSCSSSQAECKRVKETLGTPSLLSKHMRQERRDISLKPVEGVGLDSVQHVIDRNQDGQTNKQKNIEDQQYFQVESKEATALSNLDSLTDKTEIHTARSVTVSQNEQPVCHQTSCKNMEDAATGVCLQAGLSVPLPLNEVKITPPCRNEHGNLFFVTILKDPQYEDISDAEDLSNTKQEEVRFADPLYEDVSEGENPQFQNVVEEMPSLPREVSEASTKQYERLQGQAKMNPDLNEELIPKKQMSPKRETLGVALHCSCPCFVETEDGFEHVLFPKCDSDKHLGWQTNHSFSLLSVTQDRDETDEDDEWLVIPINMLDVKWEPANEDQADPEVSQDDVDDEEDVKQVYTNPPLYEVPRSASSPVPASAFSLMEVFDTPFHQAEAVQSRKAALQSFLVPSSWGIPETKAHRPQNGESHCEPEEETEDSSDYSSDSEHNYLTVSRQLLKNLSARVSPEKDNSDSEKENDHEVTNLQQCQTRGRSRSSKKDDIINLDSDTEDEGVQNCAETKTKRLFSTRKEDSGAVCLNQLKKCSPETVDSQCGTVKENSQTSELPSTASPASKRQSRCYKEVIKSENSDLRYRTEKCGHPLENKTVSQHVKKESSTQNISNDPTVIVISDSEGEENQSNIQVKRKGVFSSESMSGGSTSHGEQRRNNETMDSKHESAETKTEESNVSSAGSSKSQHQSKLQHMQSKEKRRDAHFSLSHSITKRKLIKVRVHPENVHRKANRQITSKTVGRDIEKDLIKSKPSVVSSETEDSNDTLIYAQTSPPPAEQHPQTLDSEDDSTLGPNHVIPRFFVQKSSESSERLKLLEHSTVQRQGKNETPKTPAETTKNTGSFKQMMQYLYKEIKGKTVSKPKAVSDVHLTAPLPRSTHSSSSPRQCLSLSKLQHSHSYSNTSTLVEHIQSHTPTKGPSLSAKEQVFNDCQTTFVPIRRDRKTSLESNLKTRNTCESLRETRPGPSHHDKAPRRRHGSHESVPPLMKRTKFEAIQLTKARNWDTSREQRFPVSEGYKWKNQTSFMANKRPAKRYSSPPRPHH